MTERVEMNFDPFDFALLSTSCGGMFKESDDERCHTYLPLPASTRQSRLAWKRILSRWDHYRVGVRQEKVRKLIFRGIDPRIRSDLWRKMLDISGLEASASFSYEMHVQHLREEMVTLGVTEYNIERTEHAMSNLSPREEISSPLNLVAIRQILLDVGRSYPTHRKFMPNTADGVEGQAALFRVLAVYSLYNPKINYCQGMSYLGGILLMQLEEKEAFWALVALMERRKYLSGYYNSRLERIQELGRVFKKVLERKLPDLAKHLEDLSIDPLLYLPKWILSLFTNLPCWDSVLFVWDLFLLDGSIVIFQTSLAILTLSAADLLKLDDVNLVIPYLQRIPHEIANLRPLSVAIEEIRFEDWEVICIQTLVHQETTRCPRCRRGNSTCRCRQKRSLKGGSVIGKMWRTLTRRDRVAARVPAVRVASESDSSFEVLHSANSPVSSAEMLQTPKTRKGLKRLVGSSASLQMEFQQFQRVNSRRTSKIRRNPAIKDLTAFLSPLELGSVGRNVTFRKSTAISSSGSPPSPLELTQLRRNIPRISTPNQRGDSKTDVSLRRKIRCRSNKMRVPFFSPENPTHDDGIVSKSKSPAALKVPNHYFDVFTKGGTTSETKHPSEKSSKRKSFSSRSNRKPLQNLNLTQ